ncbi:MAG: hypothetical protein IPK14_01410 [Blastocatellia bacterium]|nr:hypothetical protein [Blastocatellia bacterium]MBL8193191.1 hypothetical protein [Blastocatellia bacterium]MBN8721555.1 hypothetical protein [Acidobacteriota bacterium]
MTHLFNCFGCNQLIQRALIQEEKFYCIQCLSNQSTGELEALYLIESSVEVAEVEVLNEMLAIR